MAVVQGEVGLYDLAYSYPFPADIAFTPTVVTVTGGGFSTITYTYSGSFQQSGEGVISGTVTGIAAHYSGADFRPDMPSSSLGFIATGFTVDFATLQDAVEAQETSGVDAASLILAGDDIIYSSRASGHAGNDALYGSAQTADLLLGGEGNDVLFGLLENDTLIGGPGDDKLFTTGGDNRFIGGPGDDLIDARTGFHSWHPGLDPVNEDVAVYEGPSGGYTLSFELYGGYSQSLTVIDRTEGRDGTDTLYFVEQLEFSDQILDLSLFTAADLPPAEMTELATLYIAYFDRAPDAMGLYYWAAQMQAGMTLEEISGHFLASQESQDRADLLGSAEVAVAAVYENVLNRAPEAEGLAFWTAMLQEDRVSRSAFTLEVIRGAMAGAAGEDEALTAQRAADQAYLTDKTNLGLYFATERGMSDVENAQAVLADFDGTVESFMAGRALVDGFYAEAQDAETGELLIQLVGLQPASEPIVLDLPFIS